MEKKREKSKENVLGEVRKIQRKEKKRENKSNIEFF
jgi:hypothetical protein